MERHLRGRRCRKRGSATSNRMRPGENGTRALGGPSNRAHTEKTQSKNELKKGKACPPRFHRTTSDHRVSPGSSFLMAKLTCATATCTGGTANRTKVSDAVGLMEGQVMGLPALMDRIEGGGSDRVQARRTHKVEPTTPQRRMGDPGKAPSGNPGRCAKDPAVADSCTPHATTLAIAHW